MRIDARFSRDGMDGATALAEPPLRAELEALAGDLERRAPEILDAVRMRLAHEVAELRALDDPELVHVCRHSVSANVHAGLAHLRANVATPTDAPIDARHQAQVWARRGVPAQLLLRCHAVAQAAAWDEVIDAIEASDPVPAVRSALIKRASHIVFGYVNGVAGHALDAYEAERGEKAGSPELHRLRLVERILQGEDDRGVGLGYELAMHHLGFVAWGRSAAAVPDRLRERTDRRVIAVRPTDRSVWGWIGGFEDMSLTERRAITRMPDLEQANVAFGSLRHGAEGFRATFEQARLAQRVAATSGRGVTLYRDVALEALGSRDTAHARQFVAEELGPLAAQDAKTSQLRDTLRAYFAAAGNASACGAALGVHDQTIAYRLRRIEERLGHPVASRRAELELALRLDALLRD